MQIKLYELRKKKNLTQKQMAKQLQISENAYRNKELGHSAFKSDEMFIIADILEESIGEIFTPTNPRNVVSKNNQH
ncbi:helix-turn-helix transcriptional regulator [Streptococcus suis]|uniref:helix-turn-helix transcriptional regulator n=1 Tax=Streptococcus suis TaxID=1307 RepID=UPI001ABE4901|nr:helix-turn-helix transcriptional regulator [Streptococcus suis]